MSKNKYSNAPTVPNVLVVLSDVLNLWVSSGRPWPETMPDGLNHGAKWWVDLQSKPNNEQPRLKQKRADKNNIQPGYYWDTPYIDRVVYTLKLFLSLPKKSQQVVVTAADKGIYWRGDDVCIFLLNDVSVVGEMRKIKKMGLVAYQKEASKILSGFVGR